MNALEVRKASKEDLEFLASVLILADQDTLAGREVGTASSSSTGVERKPEKRSQEK